MPTPLPPSLLWGTVPAAPPAVDPPIQQDATFAKDPGAQRLYYSYLDSQARAGATHLTQSVTGGLTGTWAQLDAQSPTVAIGQWVCLAGSPINTVTLATLTSLAASGGPLGIALTPGTPGGWMRLGLQGLIPRAITGLLLGSNLFAIVNTSTGYTTSVTTVGSNNYPVGTIDAAANLNCHIQLPPAPGGSGLTVAGTGFWPVVGGVPGSTARAVNLASNGVNGDVTGLLAYINGGHLQGDIEVTHTNAGQFDATHQIAYCDTATGTCTVTFPPATDFTGNAIPADWQVLVVDTAGQAPNNVITVNPNGESAWDPNAGAFGTSNIILGGSPNTAGTFALWQWDINKLHWVLIGSSHGPGGIAAPSTIIAANTTIQPSQVWNLFQAVAGGYTMTLGAILAGVLYRFQHVNGAAGTNALETAGQAVTLSRGSNTFGIEDPQNRFAALANNVSFLVSKQVYEFMLDITNNVLRCMRQVQ